jgi:hypothetical protein
MDGKSRILIVSFLGRIQVASKKKHRKAGGKAFYIGICGVLWPAFNVVQYHSPLQTI